MKHLLGIKELTKEEIIAILDRADRMKREVLEAGKKDNCLSGKSIITLFYENSTRTRLSFELASKYLGATAANITASGSSVAKGETLEDTGKTIDETFGLIETVEKAAELYMISVNAGIKNGITDSQLKDLAKVFGLNYRKEYLD